MSLYDQIFNQNSGQDLGQVKDIDELMKAINAGTGTGIELEGQLTNGSALKYESLEATLKNITYDNRHFVFYNDVLKKPAKSNVEQYNQLVSYGNAGKYSIAEGELPDSADSQYRREAEFIKYKGVVGQVTDVAEAVETQIDVMQQEVTNKMRLLLQSIEDEMHFGNAAVDPFQFDGVYSLHKRFNGASNVNYTASPYYLDLKGRVLTDDAYNQVSANVVNLGYGLVTDMYAPSSVWTNYTDQKYDLRRTDSPEQVRNGVFGQRVVELISQFGTLTPHTTIFGRRSKARRTSGDTAAAQAAKAPAAITPDTGTPLVAVADTASTEFGTDYAGDYYVAVAAVNKYGEGPMVALDSSAVSVSATQSIDMTFAITDNAYPATGFVIYRSEKDPAGLIGDTDLFPVFSVTKTQLTEGFDGASAGTVRDRNYDIPNTEKAFLYEKKNPDILAIKELGKMKKLDLAITNPTRRFAILYYLTMLMYSPKKIGVINNIGGLTT